MSCENVLVVAGEASGDVHAANLIRELKSLRPEIGVHAVGGENLEQAGADILVRSSELSVVGIFEVLSHLGPILKAYRKITDWIQTCRPSLLILVDFPEFNLLIAKKAKALGIPVFYYISPQIWAWRQRRVKKIRRLVDRMVVILPFEKAFYTQRGMDVEFVGHPLLDSVGTKLTRQEFFNKFAIPSGNRLVCLLPGSRLGEIRRHLGLFLQAAVLIHGNIPDMSFCLPIATGLQTEAVDLIEKGLYMLKAAAGPEIHIVQNLTHDAMGASDLIIAASGTVTLEAAILKIPMIVTYRVSPLTYHLGRRFINVKWVSLVNLIAGRQIVPEILQDEARPEVLSRQAARLLTNRDVREKMIQELDNTVRLLGEPGAAARAASVAVSMLDT